MQSRVVLFLLITCRWLRGADFDLQLKGEYGTSQPAWHVAVAGQYAYLAVANELLAIDVTNPSDPRQVGRYATTPRAVTVLGRYAYVVDGRGLLVIDVNIPADPARVGQISISDSALDVAVAGHYAYVAAGSNGLQVIDVANPANPRWVGGCDTVGTSWDVAVSGQRAYVADRGGGLVVIDVSDPTNPQGVGGYSISDARKVAVSGNYAYLGGFSYCCGSVLFVIDISDPSHLQPAGSVYTQGPPLDVAVVGNLVCIATLGMLEVVDVSTPASPRRAGLCHTTLVRSPDQIGGVTVSGQYAYVADYDGGLKVVDVGTPANPQRIGWITTGGDPHDVAVKENYAYVADFSRGLKVIDLSNPAAPEIVGHYVTLGRARGIALSGNYAYLADRTFQEGQFVIDGEGLVVFDVSNLAQPRKVGSTFVNSSPDTALVFGATGVAMASNRLYFANGTRGLLLFDISDPTNAVPVGVYQGGGYAHGVAVSGDYVFLANASPYPQPAEGLVVLNVTNPASPQRVGGYRTNGYVNSVVVSGTRAYLAARGQGLEILDVSNPSNPRRLGAYDTWDALDVAVDAGYAYVADGNLGLVVIDIRDPARLQRVGGNSGFFASAVAVHGNHVYATARRDGLMILKTYQPPPRLERFRSGPYGFEFVVMAPAGQFVRIDRSTDLFRWEPWVMLFAPSGELTFVDPAGSLPERRFYRAVVP